MDCHLDYMTGVNTRKLDPFAKTWVMYSVDQTSTRSFLEAYRVLRFIFCHTFLLFPRYHPINDTQFDVLIYLFRICVLSTLPTAARCGHSLDDILPDSWVQAMIND
jgi:hypothetical protein